MAWKDTLNRENLKSFANHTADEVLTAYVPKIRQFFVEKVGPTAINAARDDENMILFSKSVYSLLPTKVRWVVREKTFIRFCLTHRDRLLTNIPQDARVTDIAAEDTTSIPPPLPVLAIIPEDARITDVATEGTTSVPPSLPVVAIGQDMRSN